MSQKSLEITKTRIILARCQALELTEYKMHLTDLNRQEIVKARGLCKITRQGKTQYQKVTIIESRIEVILRGKGIAVFKRVN